MYVHGSLRACGVPCPCGVGVLRVPCSYSLLHMCVGVGVGVPLGSARVWGVSGWGDWCGYGVHLCRKVLCGHGFPIGVGVRVRAGFLCTCGVPSICEHRCVRERGVLCESAGVACVSAWWGLPSVRRVPRPRPAPGSAPPPRPHLPYLPSPTPGQDQKPRPSRRVACFLATEPELPSHLNFRGEGQGSGVGTSSLR